MAYEGDSGSLWKHFGTLCGHVGPTLRVLWGHFAQFGTTLGALWGHFGPLWGHFVQFGVTLGSLWVQFGSLWGHFEVTLGLLLDNFGLKRLL